MFILKYDKSRMVRKAAAYALWRLRGEKVYRLLIAGLKDEDPRVRQNVIRGFEIMSYTTFFKTTHRERITELLISEINDERTWVKESIIMALGEIGEEEAIEPLFSAYRDKNPSVRRRILIALYKIAIKQPNNIVRGEIKEFIARAEKNKNPGIARVAILMSEKIRNHEFSETAAAV